MRHIKFSNIAIAVLVVCMVFSLTGCGSSSGSKSHYASNDSIGVTADFGGSNAGVAGWGSSKGYDEYTYSQEEINEIIAEANSASGYRDNSYGPEAPKDGSDFKETKVDTSESSEISFNQEKLVYQADVSMEMKDLRNNLSALKDLIQQYNGIIQSDRLQDSTPEEYRSVYDFEMEVNRKQIKGYLSYTATVRIPTKNFEAFLNSANSLGHLTDSSSAVVNISQQYYDTKSYLDSYRNQLEVLQGMYSMTGSITEMLEIESRISEVQAEINRLTTEIQRMDIDVAYSTVNLYIDEVVEYSEYVQEEKLTYFQVLSSRFQDGWDSTVEWLKDFTYWLAENIFGLVIFGLVVFLVVFLIKKIVKRNKRKIGDKPPKPPKMQKQKMGRPIIGQKKEIPNPVAEEPENNSDNPVEK